MCTDLDEEEEDTCCIRKDWDRWTILSRSITVLYFVVCFGYTMIMRLYLKAYYCSAYVAGWGIIITSFVLWDNVCQIRNALGCKLKLFTAYQVVLNALYLLCTIFMVVGYVVLTAISFHTNYDYAYATGFSFVNTLFLAYLLITSAMAFQAARSPNYRQRTNSLAWTAFNGYELEALQNGNQLMYDELLYESDSTENCCTKCCHSHKTKRCTKACRCIWRIFVAVGYYPMMFLLIILLGLSTCHPYFVLIDTLQFREAKHMYTVEVEGHRPLALFLKCTGTGDTTLVYENGLGGMAYMQWEFLPQMLNNSKYTICVHDRRGYGWSEGAPHDYLNLLWKEPQWSKINSQFFIKLVEKANLTVPFYYIGHSYGGSHLMYTYRQRPDLIKGMIFLDSIKLNAADILTRFMELVINFQPSGLFYALVNSGVLFDFTKAFDTVGDFSEVSLSTLNQLKSALTSTTYLESYLREWRPLKDKESIYYTHPKAIYNNEVVDKPTLVIDKDGREYWFPDDKFSVYNQYYYAQVSGTSHTTLVYSMNRTQITADLIDNFVQFVENSIDSNKFLTNKIEILTED